MSTERFCFVHAADLHLDTPFEGLRDVAPGVAAVLREASLDAFDALVDLCVAREAAFLLLAGDVYDGAERGLRAQLRFRQGLERLSSSGVAVFVVHGNHDPTEEGWSAIRDWPEGVHVFGSDRVESVPVERAGERIATVHGISYAERVVTANLSLAFPRLGSTRASETGLRVGLLHCNAVGDTRHAPYAPCSVSDLREGDMDYWALGHVHSRRILSEDPWVVYPGNLQGRSPRASERGPKGALVVDVAPGPAGLRVEGATFEPLDRVRFLEVALDVESLPDLAAVERALQERADGLREEHAGRALVLSARLEGRSALRRDLARPEVPGELLESLRDGRRADEPFAWWASLASEVRLPVDRDALRESEDVQGQLVRLAAELASEPDRGQRFCRAALEELPETLQNVRMPRFEGESFEDLIAAAEQEALERLAGEDALDGTS